MYVKVVKELFPGHEVIEDYKHPKLLYSNTQRAMQLDVYVPSLKLALEYHGIQHYATGDDHYYGDVNVRMGQDEEKVQRCNEHGISLVAVPFWWDQTRPSLIPTILERRPDLREKLKHFLGEVKEEEDVLK